MNNYGTVQRNKKHTEHMREWERQQIHRLFWVLLLFLAVFLGKQVYPGQIMSAGERVLHVLSKSIDAQAVFTQLGDSITREGGVLEGLGEFCTEVFGAQTEAGDISVQETAVLQIPLPSVRSGLLTSRLEESSLSVEEEAAPVIQDQPEAVPAVGTVLTIAPQTEQALPEGYTADELSFGALETISPVLGYLNSGFGYRDHPVNGKYSIHGGADISANAGDAIAAFADGVVEYVGEDDSYGLYLQLDHGNEIKSFYAHCQDVCVQKGEYVTAGETVAIVGSTGRTTGPHLHLELKCCGMRVDPAYYIEFL